MITSRAASKTFASSHVSTGSQVGYERASETQRSSPCPWTYPLLDASYETRAPSLFITRIRITYAAVRHVKR